MSKTVLADTTEVNLADLLKRLERLEREVKLAMPNVGDIKATYKPIAGLTGEQEIDPSWLLMDGASVSTTKWPELASMLGETGATMTLPNAVGRTLFGRSTSGTLATAGSTGGAETTSLAIGNMPAHTHSISNYVHNHGAPSGNFMTTNGSSASGANGGNFTTFIGQNQAGSTANDLGHSHGGATGSQGSGTAFTNLPPYLVVQGWLIYAGLKQA
jgi:microcystin-dependent protein